jgi:spore maturation protein CgeB
LLHERTQEALACFEEGKEIACFASPEELASKVLHYLDHPEERDLTACAGRRRCVPAYSYDARMQVIVDHHRRGSPVAVRDLPAANERAGGGEGIYSEVVK